jgi:hypothetical protein
MNPSFSRENDLFSFWISSKPILFDSKTRHAGLKSVVRPKVPFNREMNYPAASSVVSWDSAFQKSSN